MTSSGTALANPYELVSVRAVPAPEGTVGKLWHRYEIAQGGNRIVGYRQGVLATVKTDLEQLVVQLNERRLHHRGRVHVALSPKSSASAAKRG